MLIYICQVNDKPPLTIISNHKTVPKNPPHKTPHKKTHPGTTRITRKTKQVTAVNFLYIHVYFQITIDYFTDILLATPGHNFKLKL